MATLNLALACLLAICPVALAQEGQTKAPPQPGVSAETLQWAVALGGRFAQLHDPVTSIYARARLAGLICPHDPAAASLLFRGAATSMKTLPARAFTSWAPLLPVASFSGLWKFVAAAGLRCDSGLSAYLGTDSARLRMDEERRAANSRIQEADDLLESDADPERAAQLAAGAFEAADPNTFDMDAGSHFLSKLRDRAPDLSDDLFPKSLALINSAAAPNLSAFMQLGDYLFVAPKLLERDDKLQESASIQLNGRTYTDLTKVRHSSNPDDVQAFVEAAGNLIENVSNPAYDSGAANAVGSELLKATAEDLPGSYKSLRLSFQDAGLGVVPEDPGPGTSFSALGRRALTRIFGALAAGRFQEARDRLSDLDDTSVRREVAHLAGFAEAAAAVRKKDVDTALHLANDQRAGVKRALLYGAVVSAAKEREVALATLHLARKDAQLLPSELQACVLSAVAGATVPVDAENAFGVISDLVTALNSARANPRPSRFDPKSLRGIFSKTKTDTSTDAALIVCGTRGIYEAIDTGSERRNYPLRAGAAADQVTVPAFLRRINVPIDFPRLESYLLGLRNETQFAMALTSLAELRLKKQPIPPVLR